MRAVEGRERVQALVKAARSPVVATISYGRNPDVGTANFEKRNQAIVGFESWTPIFHGYIVRLNPGWVTEDGADFFVVAKPSAIKDKIKNGGDRFLLEMATGTGKTNTSAAIIKMFLRLNVNYYQSCRKVKE